MTRVEIVIKITTLVQSVLYYYTTNHTPECKHHQEVAHSKNILNITSPSQCRIITGLDTIQDQYQGFLIDAWGVLHDGVKLYPHALDCLEKLHSNNKRVIILSNAARRRDVMIKELEVLNISLDLYQALLSSGELTWQSIRHFLDSNLKAYQRGYYMGPERSRGLLDGLELEWVDELEVADFILNTGAPEGNPPSTAESESLLVRAAANDIPMICANPDLIAIRGGQAGISAGALASRYQELGASQIEYHGKPYAPIYIEALALLDMAPSQVLAVGDAFETDIRGGINAGLDTCLIAAGIHRNELLPLSAKTIQSVPPPNAMPTYASEYLAW